MKLKFLLPALILGAATVGAQAQKKAQKKADQDTEAFRYEIQAEGVGVQGTYLVKVWTYSKKPTIAMTQAQKNAVHGVIFKGFAGAPGVAGRKPLVADAAAQSNSAAFFDEFFSPTGSYMRYVSLVGNGQIETDDLIKIGKEYKIGVVVSVNADELRKALEKEGVVKALNSGF